jgi:hypothetical protein
MEPPVASADSWRRDMTSVSLCQQDLSGWGAVDLPDWDRFDGAALDLPGWAMPSAGVFAVAGGHQPFWVGVKVSGPSVCHPPAM